jgi:two-component system, LuxR family, response regulator FixJ
MSVESTVFVVDDDEQTRKSICSLIKSMGVKAESFASAEEFLDYYTQDRTGCLVTDLRMSGMSGIELQNQLQKRHIFLPVVMITAYARTHTTVRAVQAGALAVIDKPYADDDLWDAIREALANDAANREKYFYRQEIRSRIAQLTSEERKILDLILNGLPNKAIAKELDVSIRTIENRRQALCSKLQVASTAELIKLVVEADN